MLLLNRQTESERKEFNILFRDERGREKKSSMIMILKQVYRTNSFHFCFLNQMQQSYMKR